MAFEGRFTFGVVKLKIQKISQHKKNNEIDCLIDL